MKGTKAEYLQIEKLHPFEGHPFKVADNEEMDQLVESILVQGVLTPLVVRPLDNGEYEVISGHRRLHACKRAGIESVPAVITEMDRDIAVEYIADPSLFFLDEPDSGLDGVMARALMENLRHIADEGKIVMVISHGPDRAADLFDKVIVLAKSVQDNCGHLAFFGTVSDAYKFFDTETLEGVVRRINREDEGGDGLSDYYIQKYNSQI